MYILGLGTLLPTQYMADSANIYANKHRALLLSKINDGAHISSVSWQDLEGPCLHFASSLESSAQREAVSPSPLVSLTPPKLQVATNHMAHKQLRFVAFGTSQGRGQSGGQRGCGHHTVQSHYSNALWESFQSMGLFVLPLGKTGGRAVGVYYQAHPHNTASQKLTQGPGILETSLLPRRQKPEVG